MSERGTVFVVDDNEAVREGLCLLLESNGLQCETFTNAPEFLERHDPTKTACLVLDVRMPRMTGLDLQTKLCERGSELPIIFITGHGDIPLAVEAMRRGALDFIRKPFREQDLLHRINEALDINAVKLKRRHEKEQLLARIASLSEKERLVFDLVGVGMMNKSIALDLNVSERTVEVHRSQVMRKLQARTLAELIRAKIEVDSIAQSSLKK